MSIGQGVLLRFCRFSTRSVLVFIRMVPVGLISFALLLPANAQYWGDPWGGRQQQRQQLYNPFGGGFWGDRPGGFWGDRQAPRYPRQREREREQPPDYSRAPRSNEPAIEWRKSALYEGLTGCAALEFFPGAIREKPRKTADSSRAREDMANDA